MDKSWSRITMSSDGGVKILPQGEYGPDDASRPGTSAYYERLMAQQTPQEREEKIGAGTPTH